MSATAALNVIRSGEPELLMSFGNNASSFGSAGILAITGGRIYTHGDERALVCRHRDRRADRLCAGL